MFCQFGCDEWFRFQVRELCLNVFLFYFIFWKMIWQRSSNHRMMLCDLFRNNDVTGIQLEFLTPSHNSLYFCFFFSLSLYRTDAVVAICHIISVQFGAIQGAHYKH